MNAPWQRHYVLPGSWYIDTDGQRQCIINVIGWISWVKSWNQQQNFHQLLLGTRFHPVLLVSAEKLKLRRPRLSKLPGRFQVSWKHELWVFISLGSSCSLSSILMENCNELLKTLRARTCEIHYMWIAEIAIQQGPDFILQCTKVQLQGKRFTACLRVIFSL